MPDPVRTLKTSEAAAALNVSPNTLRAWERRFAYPKPQRTAGQHRLYTDRDIFALRDALQQGLSISSAVARAREALSEDTDARSAPWPPSTSSAPTPPWRRRWPALGGARHRGGPPLVAWATWPSATAPTARPGPSRPAGPPTGCSRAQRLAPPPSRSAGVLIGDATRDDLDPDAIALRALQLFTGRGGARVLALPVGGIAGLGDVLHAFGPEAVVLAGASGDDDVARWAYGVRSAGGPLPVSPSFRRGGRADRGAYDRRAILPDSRWRSAPPCARHP